MVKTKTKFNKTFSVKDPDFGIVSNDVYDEFNGNTRLGKSYFGIQPGWFGLGLGYCIR
jgi:hypothetical protein